jgi:hypothetical protein
LPPVITVPEPITTSDWRLRLIAHPATNHPGMLAARLELAWRAPWRELMAAAGGKSLL